MNEQLEILQTAARFCPACATIKPLSDFYRNRSHPSGRHGYCAACMRPYQRRAYRRRKAIRTTRGWRPPDIATDLAIIAAREAANVETYAAGLKNAAAGTTDAKTGNLKGD